jgi:hypothetical protein
MTHNDNLFDYHYEDLALHGPKPVMMRSVSYFGKHCASSPNFVRLGRPSWASVLAVPMGKAIDWW